MTVVDKLSGLTAGIGEAESVDNVVQTTLDEAQQIFTGVAAGTGSLLVVGTELLLEDAIDELDLLLLGQLHGVLGLLGSSLAAGVLLGVLGVAHGSGRDAQRAAALQNGLRILCHYDFLLPIRRGVSSEDGSHCEQWG